MEVNLDSSELVNVIYQKLDQLHEFEPTRVSKTDLPWQRDNLWREKYGNRGWLQSEKLITPYINRVYLHI